MDRSPPSIGGVQGTAARELRLIEVKTLFILRAGTIWLSGGAGSTEQAIAGSVGRRCQHSVVRDVLPDAYGLRGASGDDRQQAEKRIGRLRRRCARVVGARSFQEPSDWDICLRLPQFW